MIKSSNLLWDDADTKIFEIKIGGIDGLSFRLNQVFKIRKGSNLKERVVCDIIRDMDGEDEVFMVYTHAIDDIDDIKLTKLSKGLPVYVTFDI